MNEKVRRTNVKLKVRSCKKCRYEQSIDNFRKVRQGRYRSHTCDSCQKIWFQKWYLDNKDHILELSKAYYDNNTEKVRKRHVRWHLDNKDSFRKYCNEYWNYHIGARRHKCRKYQAALLSRTPTWLTPEHIHEMDSIYEKCPPFCEVDHIVPLQGINVSGLHVPWNLQYLTISDNRSKSNKY
jgi:hypothetical protein